MSPPISAKLPDAAAVAPCRGHPPCLAVLFLTEM